MNPFADVSRSGMTWYNSFGPLGKSSVSSLVFFRRSTKSGVSKPPGTVEVMDWYPDGVARPDGVSAPAPGAAADRDGLSSSSSSSSGSDSSSSSSSSSENQSRTTSMAHLLLRPPQSLPTDLD